MKTITNVVLVFQPCFTAVLYLPEKVGLC